MRPPSENFRKSASTFHSMSVGGRLVGLLKKISYSIFKRRSCESRTFSSSSVVTSLSTVSLVEGPSRGDVPVGHQGDGTKVSIGIWPSASGQHTPPMCSADFWVNSNGATRNREER